ncbi:MAG: diphthine synthase [Euryarchaeota archaeon]|nr:diphthine synthase [Euryarchaeota archaeon]|tara:strand:+ start:220 stop:1065 length:846 start_codon:yes stop_codon:yes gene_type:complete
MMCSGAARFTMTDDGVAPGLWLIGLGPGDLDHITERARRVARGCSKRYLEGYTAVLPSAEEEKLESVVGPWERLMRDGVESPENMLDEARESAVALLVVGDPMQATTHIDLEERCAEEGIGFQVIPGLTATALAVSLSGLQSYRFGRQVTIPFSDGDYLPTSPFEMICRNKEAGMHTLALLDLDPTGMGLESPRPMTPGEAVDHLVRMNERSGGFEESVEEWDGLLLSDLGTEEESVVSGSMRSISKIERGHVHALIIAAEFSGMEAEAFERRRLTKDTTG